MISMLRKNTTHMGIAVAIISAMLIFSLSGPQAIAAEKVTLRIIGETGMANSHKAIAKRFEATHPDVKIEIEPLPWEQAQEKLLTSYAANNPPDIAIFDGTWLPVFMDKGALVDLNKYNVKELKGLFLPEIWNMTEWKGAHYGLPYDIDTRAMFYRADMFREAGLDPSKPPVTWEDLVSYGKKLTKGKTYGVLLQPGIFEFQGFLVQAGGNYLDSNGNPIINNENGQRALEFYEGLLSKEKIAITVPQGMNRELFLKKDTAAILFSGPWYLGPLSKTCPEMAGKWRVAVLPRDKYEGTFLGGTSMGIFRQSKHPDVAYEYMKFAASQKENVLEMNRLLGALPASSIVWKDPEILKEWPYFGGQAALGVFIEQIKSGRVLLNIPQVTEMQSIVNRALQQVIYEKRPIKAALDEAANSMKRTLGR